MHRDIKPDNILFNKDCTIPIIVDFGLACFIKTKKRLFERCGTPGYVAPEIANLKTNDK